MDTMQYLSERIDNVAQHNANEQYRQFVVEVQGMMERFNADDEAFVQAVRDVETCTETSALRAPQSMVLAFRYAMVEQLITSSVPRG